MLEYIREQLPTTELLAQLAEEAAELGHAALKLRRVYDGTNPTPTTYEDALANLHEEIADVQLLLKVLELDDPNKRAKHAHIMQEKITRWANRLRKNGRKAERLHNPARVVELEAELAAALKYISAQKDCATCKHQPPENNPACTAANYDCADCDGTDCLCMFCSPKADKWEWRGVHGA